MPYVDVPDFVDRLRQTESTAALALELTILTATRTGEVRGARWNEIDLEAKIWAIPGSRMKSGRQHRVPLSGRAVAIIEQLAEVKTGDFIFGGQRQGRPLSRGSMQTLMARMNIEDATPHGFRSAFRDWAGDSLGAFNRQCRRGRL